MTQRHTRRGFTLIELLVVVLIIGILAAVALPQYQVAVKKAQLIRLLPLLDAAYKSEKSYFLQHGEYVENFALLDLEISSQGCTTPSAGSIICDHFRVGIHGSPSHIAVALLDNEGHNELQYAQFFTDHDVNIKEGAKTCFANGSLANKVCKSLGIKTDLGKVDNNWEYRYIIE